MWTVLRIVLAVAVALVVYVIGASMLRKFHVAPPEEPDPEDLKVMHDIAEKSPVTLLIQFAWSVRTEFVGPR